MGNKLHKQNSSLVGLKACEQLIKISLHIPYLKDENPIGILLIAQPGMGKSMLLTRFDSENIITVSDLTGFGLEKTILECKKLSKGYILIPDLLRLQARNKGWQAFLTLTNIILEEGLVSIARGDVTVKFKKPVNFGIITAITADCFQRNLSYFSRIGFTSRFGLFSYSYEGSDYQRIEALISKKSNGENEKLVIKPPKNLRGEKNILVSSKMAEYIKNVGKTLSNGKPSTFRSIKFVRRLVKAHALMNGRNKVALEDIREIFALTPFFVPPYPTSTDLEYRICKGIPENTLLKHYSEHEIYEAHKRLVGKQINWGLIVKDRSKNLT